MKKILLSIFLTTLVRAVAAQDIPYIQADQITRWKQSDSDTVYVLNFWATWCAPCVAELPELEKLHAEYAGQAVKVILISTDFRRDVEKKVKPFVQRKALKSQVMFMNEPTPNDWIDLVSPQWTGAIPATLIVCKRRGFEHLFEKQVTYEELEKAVHEAKKF